MAGSETPLLEIVVVTSTGGRELLRDCLLSLERHPVASGRMDVWVVDNAAELGEHDQGEVDAVNGAFMLVRREALNDVGLLDEGYWLYMDDLDWCYRFKKRGWKVWYDGRVTIVHVKGGTTVHEHGRARHRGL